jgi:hypothetical protein
MPVHALSKGTEVDTGCKAAATFDTNHYHDISYAGCIYAILESRILSSLRTGATPMDPSARALDMGHLEPAVHVETLLLGEDLASIEFFTFWKILPASQHD